MNFHHLFSTVNDVGHILAVLRKVGFTSAAWWELGIELELGLDRHAMETDHKTSYRCMLETIEIWLRNGDDPSWEALADAVSQCGRGGKNIAAAIQLEIGRGEFKLLQKLNNNNNTQIAPIALPPSTTHPQLWANCLHLNLNAK